MKTKEKILQEASRLFSTKGYAATGVEEIAAAVGIKAASFYKHYRNKRAIFEAIFEETGKRYNDFTNSISVYNDDRSKNELENLRSITADELVLKVKKPVQYWLNDEYIANLEK